MLFFFCFSVLLFFFFYCAFVRCRSCLFRTVRSTFFLGKRKKMPRMYDDYLRFLSGFMWM